MTCEEKIESLEKKLDLAEEKAFLSSQDLRDCQTINSAYREFLQNLYYSCADMEESELELSMVMKNLRNNIQTFARDYRIRL